MKDFHHNTCKEGFQLNGYRTSFLMDYKNIAVVHCRGRGYQVQPRRFVEIETGMVFSLCSGVPLKGGPLGPWTPPVLIVVGPGRSSSDFAGSDSYFLGSDSNFLG